MTGSSILMSWLQKILNNYFDITLRVLGIMGYARVCELTQQLSPSWIKPDRSVRICGDFEVSVNTVAKVADKYVYGILEYTGKLSAPTIFQRVMERILLKLL